jgi:hypothetical protein
MHQRICVPYRSSICSSDPYRTRGDVKSNKASQQRRKEWQRRPALSRLEQGKTGRGFLGPCRYTRRSFTICCGPLPWLVSDKFRVSYENRKVTAVTTTSRKKLHVPTFLILYFETPVYKVTASVV